MLKRLTLFLIFNLFINLQDCFALNLSLEHSIKTNSDKINLDTLPDGRKLWEKDALKDLKTRYFNPFSEDYVEEIYLTIDERLYWFGHMLSSALPSAKLAKGTQIVDEAVVNIGDFTKNIKSTQLIKNLGNEVTVVIAKSGDDLKYLNTMGADAVYFTGQGTSGTIVIREGASRLALVEEALHHAQRLKHGDDFFIRNRTALEIEAQEILIRMGRNENWGIDEIHRLKEAKEAWIKLSKNEK